MAHYRLHLDPQSSHQQISRLVKNLRPQTTLDVGAAQGMLGQALQGSGLTIDAVEPNPAWAEQARRYYRQVFGATVEQAALPVGAYDAIICADVLEHLVDPAAALRQLGQAAAEDAVYLISLPNTAHLAVRLMLLCGRFPAMERGPLDKTHLHFYTLRTAEEMLRAGGLVVTRRGATGAPLDEVWPKGHGTWVFECLVRCQYLMVKLLPRLFGYQWVFVAKKDEHASHD